MEVPAPPAPQTFPLAKVNAQLITMYRLSRQEAEEALRLMYKAAEVALEAYMSGKKG